MQKLIQLFFTLLVFFLCACHSKKNNEQITPVTDLQEVQTFFPVTEFILGQLTEIDSMPVTPLKIIIKDNKKDSIWMKRKDIRLFAAPFLQPVIDSVSMQKFFEEKSFMDQTINAITLTYDPKISLPDSVKLNHWDIYIDPQKNTVQQIYLVKEETKNDATITTQLTWKVNEQCSIRTIIQQPKTAPDVTEEIMKWNFDE